MPKYNTVLSKMGKGAEEGRVLATELMTKVGPALSNLYGDAARDAAAGPAAQLNRLKNAVFELGAVIGAGPMQAVGNLASAFSYLAEAAKNGLAWLSDEKTGASSWAALAFAINTVSSTLAPVAVVLGVAAASYAAYSVAATFAASVSTAYAVAKRYQEQRMAWQKDYDLAKAQGNEDAIKALNQQLDLIAKIHAANAATLSADKNNLIAPKIPGMATGGNVGGIGTGDNQLRWLDPREWVINPGAVSHWGSAVMAAMNSPMSNAGRMLAERINGLSIPAMAIQAPRLAMATGGSVGNLQQPSGATINLTINTTQPVDDTFIRRKIIPELNRYAGLKS